MTAIAASNASGVYVPASAIPAGALEVLASPAGYTVSTTDDWYASAPPALPLNRVTNLFNGSAIISSASLGSDNSRWPTTAINTGVVEHSIVRTHDYADATRRVRWSFTHANPAVPVWSLLDDCVDQAVAAGRDVVHTLFGTPPVLSARPAEASAYGAGVAAEPASLADWDAYCTAVATRYLGKVKYYEVWNEVNLSGFYTGTQTVLAQMVRRANQAIKAVDPTAKIVSPSVTSLPGGAALAYFLNMMNASDGASGTMKDWVDVVAVHLYPANAYSIATIPDMIAGIRAHMATLGIGAKPLWNTECTVLSPDFATLAPKARAAAMQQMLTLFFANASGGVDKAFWYGADSSGSLGFTQQDVDAYAAHVALLKIGVTVINKLPGGRVAAVVGGQRFLW